MRIIQAPRPGGNANLASTWALDRRREFLEVLGNSFRTETASAAARASPPQLLPSGDGRQFPSAPLSGLDLNGRLLLVAAFSEDVVAGPALAGLW